MQLKSRFVHFFLVLLMGFFGVVSLVLLELFQYEPPAAAVNLPKKAQWALRVDLEQLAKDEAYTLLFEAKDEQLITLLRKIADDRIERHNKKGKLGIDLRQNVIVFGFIEHGNKYIGLQFQVLDEQLFRENIPQHLAKGYYAQVDKTTALILFSPDQKVHDGSHEKSMLELAFNLLHDTRKWDVPVELEEPFLVLETTAFRGKTGGKMAVNLYNEGQTMRLEGHFDAEEPLETAHYSLKNTGLYINTSIIPAGLADSLNRLLPLGNYRLPELSAIVIDYQGITVAQTNAGMLPIPSMNLILESAEPFPVDSMLPKALRDGRRSVEIASMTYYLKQLDENTVFIGLDTNRILKQKPFSPCEISGSLAALNNISAGPTLLAFIDLVPQVRSGRQFVSRTEKVHFIVQRQKGNRYTVNGELLFRKDAYGLHEVVKLLIGLGVAD